MTEKTPGCADAIGVLEDELTDARGTIDDLRGALTQDGHDRDQARAAVAEHAEAIDLHRAEIGRLTAQRDQLERESRARRDLLCRVIDAFGAPDDRRMRHASVTDATVKRWCAEAGIIDAPAYAEPLREQPLQAEDGQ